MLKKEISNFLSKNELIVFRGNEKNNVFYSHWVANSYLFQLNNESILYETGCGLKRQIEIIRALRNCKNISGIYNSHNHYDHTANNGKIAYRYDLPIYFNEKTKAGLVDTNKILFEAVKLMFNEMDVKDILTRYGYNKGLVYFIDVLKRKYPEISYKLSLLNFKLYYGFINSGLENIVYLKPVAQRNIQIGSSKIYGWHLKDNFYAFETPGHTNDSLSYYLRDRKILFLGDLDFFLNPNSVNEGNIRALHHSLRKAIRLVKDDGVSFLARSHYDAVVGNDNILIFLEKLLEKQLTIYKILKKQIVKNKRWTWLELINKVLQSKEEMLHSIVEINYYKTPSFIDNYVYLVLKDLGYRFHDNYWLKD